MLQGNFSLDGNTYSFSAANISDSSTRIIGYSSHCFDVRIRNTKGGRLKVKLHSKTWVEEYDRHAPVEWPDLRPFSLSRIIIEAVDKGWDGVSKFTLEDVDLGDHATANRIEDYQRLDENPLPIQSLSF